MKEDDEKNNVGTEMLLGQGTPQSVVQGEGGTAPLGSGHCSCLLPRSLLLSVKRRAVQMEGRAISDLGFQVVGMKPLGGGERYCCHTLSGRTENKF